VTAVIPASSCAAYHASGRFAKTAGGLIDLITIAGVAAGIKGRL
jgi:hypothetical protein